MSSDNKLPGGYRWATPDEVDIELNTVGGPDNGGIWIITQHNVDGEGSNELCFAVPNYV